jgi:hypothetical protein
MPQRGTPNNAVAPLPESPTTPFGRSKTPETRVRASPPLRRVHKTQCMRGREQRLSVGSVSTSWLNNRRGALSASRRRVLIHVGPERAHGAKPVAWLPALVHQIWF